MITNSIIVIILCSATFITQTNKACISLTYRCHYTVQWATILNCNTRTEWNGMERNGIERKVKWSEVKRMVKEKSARALAHT